SDVNQLDTLGFPKRFRLVNLIDLQRDRGAGGRIDLHADRLTVAVAVRGRETSLASVEVHDGLHIVSSFRKFGERRGVADQLRQSHGLFWFPVFHVLSEERLRPKPVGRSRKLVRRLLGEKDKDPAGEWVAGHRFRKSDLKL